MGRDRWLWLACCITLGCAPLQEGAGNDDEGGTSSAGETGASSPSTTATMTTASSASGQSESSSTGATSQTTDPPLETGDTSATNGTTDSGSTTAVATAGSSDESGVPMNVHDGTYTGTMSSTITVLEVGSFPCEGTAMFTVAEGGSPQVTGTGSCNVNIPQLGAIAEATSSADGALADATASGNITMGIAAAGVAETTTWSGTFTGDAFDGTFSGSTEILGVPTTFAGTWTTTR